MQFCSLSLAKMILITSFVFFSFLAAYLGAITINKNG